MTEIPKIIHQLWSETNEPLPEIFRLFGESWKENHPDWKYEFWDNDRMNRFVQDFYPQYWETYQSFQYDVQRWDAVRYLILYRIGGMYVDFDTECLRPHNELFADKTCCFSMEPKSHAIRYNKQLLFSNSLMVSTPNHPFMKKIIETVFSYTPKTAALTAKQRGLEIMTTTGPFILVDIYNSCPDKENVFLIPAQHVSPFDKNEIALIRHGYVSAGFDNRLKDAYSVHYFWGGWV